MLCAECRVCPLYVADRERGSAPIAIGPMRFDPVSGRLDYGEAFATLTIMQAMLLARLSRDIGRLVTKESLFASMYSHDPAGGPSGGRVIETYVSTIRRKLRALGAPAEIALVWGRGYMLRLTN